MLVLDPVPLLIDVHRALRRDGKLFIQLWPFFHSEHGSHLWEWDPAGFVQLVGDIDAVEAGVRADLAHDAEWAAARIEESRELNRVTLDELQRALMAGGFYVSKLELVTNAFHLPRALARYPLSMVAIGGALLIANPV